MPVMSVYPELLYMICDTEKIRLRGDGRVVTLKLTIWTKHPLVVLHGEEHQTKRHKHQNMGVCFTTSQDIIVRETKPMCSVFLFSQQHILPEKQTKTNLCVESFVKHVLHV